MVKKISAIVLALVLCLSVVVIPASAAVELGDATIAFSLEWDKDNYSAGETAYLSVYMDAADDIELTTGSFLIGLSSDVFDSAVGSANDISTVKENAVTTEWFEAFWKPASTQLSWLTNATQIGYVTDDSTDEEKAAYDIYLKYTGGKNNQNGWHPNCAATKNGFSGSEFIADEPIMTIALVVKDDVADGTPVSAAIMSGSTTTKSGNAQTHWKYLKNPGSATTTANVAATAVSVAQAVDADSVIGAATPDLVLAQLKQQIRFPAGKETFDYRVFANVTNLEEIFTDVAGVNDKSDNTYMTEAGFIYNMGAAIDQSVALTQINGGEAVYLQQKHAYISTSTGLADYAMACVIYDIPYDAYQETVSVLAYIKYVQNGEEKVALVDAYTGTFEDLYNRNKPNA